MCWCHLLHHLLWCLYIIHLTVFLCFWQNKTCVQTLEGHAQNVSCVSFHPELPIIITGSEDGEEQSNVFALMHKIPDNSCHFLSLLIRPLSTVKFSLCRYSAHLALKHLPPWKHSELWHGESLVCVWPQGLQQCGTRIWWRQHYYQGVQKNNS